MEQQSGIVKAIVLLCKDRIYPHSDSLYSLREEVRKQLEQFPFIYFEEVQYTRASLTYRDGESIPLSLVWVTEADWNELRIIDARISIADGDLISFRLFEKEQII
jgi:hypothetical protein